MRKTLEELVDTVENLLILVVCTAVAVIMGSLAILCVDLLIERIFA